MPLNQTKPNQTEPKTSVGITFRMTLRISTVLFFRKISSNETKRIQG